MPIGLVATHSFLPALRFHTKTQGAGQSPEQIRDGSSPSYVWTSYSNTKEILHLLKIHCFGQVLSFFINYLLWSKLNSVSSITQLEWEFRLLQ